MPPGGDSAFLIFGSFDQAKERTKEKPRAQPSYKPSIDGLSKPTVACNTFFFLDKKEPKSQDKPDPSGRFVWPLRSWAATILVVTVPVVIVEVERKPLFLAGMT